MRREQVTAVLWGLSVLTIAGPATIAWQMFVTFQTVAGQMLHDLRHQHELQAPLRVRRRV